MEEERRLCFVGLTRAQHRLILSKAAYRSFRGQSQRTISSPFLGELPGDLLDVTDFVKLGAGDTRGAHARRHDREAARPLGRFRKGQLVRHPTFGLGRIAEISGIGQQTRAVVEFHHAGRKTLILEHARLEPAE
jgi:DNA helicase-2/ATP-dependent DNA helicase PcrA